MLKRVMKAIEKAKYFILAPLILSSCLALGTPQQQFQEETLEITRPTINMTIEAKVEDFGGIEKIVQDSESMRTEKAIGDKFQEYFKNYSIDGQEINLNMPFGENEERSKNEDYKQIFYYDGKGAASDLWSAADKILESKRFKSYVSEVKEPGEKVVILDLGTRKWSVSKNESLISKMKSGRYPGNYSVVYVYKRDNSFDKDDVYNYLYCIGRIGMDCSGFVYSMQKAIAAERGINLDKVLADKIGVREERLPIYIGTWLYNPEKKYVDYVQDKVSNLKAGDIILFQGKKHKHSAVIKSIDMKRGIIDYVQCTDWAPSQQRGVHESMAMFNPSNPDISLADRSLLWMQKVMPTFKGEPGITWTNDGDRYRAYHDYDENGGSVVVRLKY